LWHKLSDLKIDVLKLSEEAVPLRGSYTIGKTVKDRETGQEIVLPCSLTIGGDGFDHEFK
jgi:ubiquitin-like modifier-activating enzyme ATG7